VNRLRRSALACVLALAGLGHGPGYAQSAEGRTDWPGPGQLFVGTCYQPVDRSPEQVKRDIALMKQAGFKVVRMGDLSWDYFEPAEGRFEFRTFDGIMDEMHAAGLKVLLDIPGLPAPTWLHHKYPGVDIVNQQGTRLHAAERYMDDIGDLDYKRLAARLADTMTTRYARHPALFAIGFNNEIGNGFMSYSEADRDRFVGWLELHAFGRLWPRFDAQAGVESTVQRTLEWRRPSGFDALYPRGGRTPVHSSLRVRSTKLPQQLGGAPVAA
jgi:beta-galactosidase